MSEFKDGDIIEYGYTTGIDGSWEGTNDFYKVIDNGTSITGARGNPYVNDTRYPYDLRASAKYFRLAEEKNTPAKEFREFEIDIANLRAGDVIVEANIGGSVTRHCVRREVTAIPEPALNKIVLFKTVAGETIVAKGNNYAHESSWYQYVAKGPILSWDDFVAEHGITGIKED